MKKKIKIVILGLVGGLLGILLIWAVVFYIHGGEIKRDIFNQFSYLVCEDHVELIQYHGSKKEVKIPKTLWGRPVTVIGESCFGDLLKNDRLEKVTIPDSVKEIGQWAFNNCFRLQEVKGGRNVKIIGRGAFNSCVELRDIGELGQSTERIFARAFDDCKKLESFSFCNELSMIGFCAFAGTSLEEVKLPEKTLFFGIGVFDETPWMEKQTDEFVVLNDILIRYQGTEEIVHIPEGIKGVADDFNGVENVKDIYIPATVEYISGDNFYDYNVERIYIPKEVTKIGIYKYCDYYLEGEKAYRIWDAEMTVSILDKEKTTIITTSGSPAEAYAKEFGYQCKIVEGW